jgi:hypothetical protein
MLDKYADCWPVNDMLLARLKSSSTNYRKRQRDSAGTKALEEVEQMRKKERKKEKKRKTV